MGVVQVQLPDEVQEIINRQVAEGRATDAAEFLAEAARRYAEDLDLEGALVTEAKAGIADIEAGRFRTINTREDAELWHQDKMARVRDRLAAEGG